MSGLPGPGPPLSRVTAPSAGSLQLSSVPVGPTPHPKLAPALPQLLPGAYGSILRSPPKEATCSQVLVSSLPLGQPSLRHQPPAGSVPVPTPGLRGSVQRGLEQGLALITRCEVADRHQEGQDVPTKRVQMGFVTHSEARAESGRAAAGRALGASATERGFEPCQGVFREQGQAPPRLSGRRLEGVSAPIRKKNHQDCVMESPGGAVGSDGVSATAQTNRRGADRREGPVSGALSLSCPETCRWRPQGLGDPHSRATRDRVSADERAWTGSVCV